MSETQKHYRAPRIYDNLAIPVHSDGDPVNLSFNPRFGVYNRCSVCRESGVSCYNTCPLHPYRDIEGVQNYDKRTQAIGNYCEQACKDGECLQTCPLFLVNKRSHDLVCPDKCRE